MLPSSDAQSEIPAVQAGFPSPAEDQIEQTLDLNALLIKQPAATFFVRVEGNSMEGASIQNGDLLVVDRSIEATFGTIVVAIVNGEFTVKRFAKHSLVADHPDYPPISTKGSDIKIWGVVTYVIHKTKPCLP